MAENTAIQTVPQGRQLSRPETFAPRSLKEAFDFADMVLASGMAPKSYLEIYSKAIESGSSKEGASMKAQSAIVVALQFGMEVGFQPMQALQCIANINGNPAVWGDGALALVMNSGLLESIQEEDLEAIKKNKKATCTVKRRGDSVPRTVTFSYQDAIDAGIFSRGVWKSYPHRMCQARARAFALRDKFPDVLKGLKIAEEVMDYTEAEPTPEPARIQPTITVPKAEAPSEKPAETTAPATETADESETSVVETITIPEAKAYYAAYTKAGKTPDDSKAFLKKHFDFEDSRMIPKEHFQGCMDEATAGFPSMNVAPEEGEYVDDGAPPLEDWTGTLNMDVNPDAE